MAMKNESPIAKRFGVDACALDGSGARGAWHSGGVALATDRTAVLKIRHSYPSLRPSMRAQKTPIDLRHVGP